MSFRLKIILGIALIQVLLLSVLIWYNINILKQTNEDEIERRIHTTATLFSVSARDAIYATDLATLNSLTNELLKQPGIQYVYIKDNSDSLLSKAGTLSDKTLSRQLDRKLDQVTDGVFDIATHIEESDIVFATIRIGFVINALENAITTTTQRSIVIAIIAVILVGLVSYALGTLLTRQLTGLRLGAGIISSGKLGHQIPVYGKDELAQTAIAFNSMSKDLQSTNLMRNAIMTSAIDCIITTDQFGCVMDYNEAAMLTLGYAKKEAIGKYIFDLIEPHESESRQMTDFRRYLIEDKNISLGIRFESKIICKSGVEIPVEMVITNPASKGMESFYIFYIADISDRKQAEMLKSEFVSIVSHELRTPLTAILGALGLLQSGKLEYDNDKTRSIIDIAYNNSQRLTNLVNDLLDIQKIESGKYDMVYEKTDLNELVQLSVEQNMPFSKNFNIKIDFIKAGEPLWVKIDHNRTLQILANLISNAVKFSPQFGIVTISVKNNVDVAYVSVTDSGPGIPVDFRDRIFQKFSQAENSLTRTHAGTGLGLSISKHLVNAQGGEIGFNTELDVGTTFYFTLPKIENAARIQSYAS